MKLKYYFLFYTISLLIVGCQPNLTDPNTVIESFQKAYKRGDWGAMLNLTAKESIEEFGEKRIIECYKEMNFGYEINFVSVENDNEYLIARCTGKVWGTEMLMKIRLKKENDELRIILNSLDEIWGRAVQSGI